MLRNAVLQGCRLIGRSYPFLRTTRVIHNPLTKWASSHLTNEVAIETKLGPVDIVRQPELCGGEA